MEVYKLLIKIIADKDPCIILPQSMQENEYFKEAQEIIVYFGQCKQKVNVNFHNGEQLIISDKLANKLCFPFQNAEMNVIINKKSIKLGPLLAIYVKESQKGNFGIINNLLKDFAAQCSEIGVAFMVFTPGQSDFQKQEISGYIYTNTNINGWKVHQLPFPDIIMDRGIFGSTKDWDIAHRERKKFQEQTKILKFNAPIGNKFELYTLLKKNPIVSQYIPETKILKFFEDFKSMVNKYSSVYIKPVNGTQGQGIYKVIKKNNLIVIRSNLNRYNCKSMVTAKSIINKQFIAKRKRKFIIQREIKLFRINSSIIDFRILLQKKENLRWGVTTIIARMGKKNDITSNLSNGGSVQDGESMIRKIACKTNKNEEVLIQLLKDISILVAYTIETVYGAYGELGIDIGIDNRGNPWIIEINPRPGRKTLNLIDKSLRLKSLRIPIDYCLQLWLQHNRGNIS